MTTKNTLAKAFGQLLLSPADSGYPSEESDFSGIAVPAGKGQDVGPEQCYDPSVLLCP